MGNAMAAYSCTLTTVHTQRQRRNSRRMFQPSCSGNMPGQGCHQVGAKQNPTNGSCALLHRPYSTHRFGLLLLRGSLLRIEDQVLQMHAGGVAEGSHWCWLVGVLELLLLFYRYHLPMTGNGMERNNEEWQQWEVIGANAINNNGRAVVVACGARWRGGGAGATVTCQSEKAVPCNRARAGAPAAARAAQMMMIRFSSRVEPSDKPDTLMMLRMSSDTMHHA